MRTAVAIVVLMGVVLPICGQGKASHPQDDNGHTQRDSNSPVAVTVNCAEGAIPQEHPAKEANGTSNRPEGYFKTLISANNLPNDLLFLVGTAGVGVAVWTLFTIKRQVNTFVSKERARITVDIEPLKPDGRDDNYGVFGMNP
jgi:hypothetical protein